MFSVGQKVIVDLPRKSESLKYANPGITSQMYEWNGKTVTIRRKGNTYVDGYSNYNIAEDDGYFNWNERWFRSVKKSNIGRW